MSVTYILMRIPVLLYGTDGWPEEKCAGLV